MNKVAAFALWRKNSILSMSEKMFCPPQPLRFWITPACAGKRIKLRKRHSICGDHPRACGEKTMRFIIASTVSGSPPRVRGKEKTPVGHLPDLGITPAYAGKSLWSPLLLILAEDHPRVCGEKVNLEAGVCRVWGSPPRMRGKAPINRHQAEEHGVTPACAGKSAGTGSRSGASWDHPRLCGEKWQGIWNKGVL